jgi:hypothetical protein
MRTALSLLLTVGLALTVTLVSSCDYIADWRDSQVDRSPMLAKGSRIDPPPKPVEVPGGLEDELPFNPTWTVLEYSDAGDNMSLRALSSQDAGATSLWLIQRLGELGFSTDDNASRLLEGATYTKTGGDWQSVQVKVDLNTSEQCIVELRAGKS